MSGLGAPARLLTALLPYLVGGNACLPMPLGRVKINYKGWFRAWNVNSEIFVGNVHERNSNVKTGIQPVEYVPTVDAKGATTNFHADAVQGVLPLPALNQNVDFGKGPCMYCRVLGWAGITFGKTPGVFVYDSWAAPRRGCHVARHAPSAPEF